jgi:hypothetical protein
LAELVHRAVILDGRLHFPVALFYGFYARQIASVIKPSSQVFQRPTIKDERSVPSLLQRKGNFGETYISRLRGQKLPSLETQMTKTFWTHLPSNIYCQSHPISAKRP